MVPVSETPRGSWNSSRHSPFEPNRAATFNESSFNTSSHLTSSVPLLSSSPPLQVNIPSSIDSASLRNAFGLWTASQSLGGVFFCSLLSVSSGRIGLGIPQGKRPGKVSAATRKNHVAGPTPARWRLPTRTFQTKEKSPTRWPGTYDSLCYVYSLVSGGLGLQTVVSS